MESKQEIKEFNWDQIAKHCTRDNLWLVIDNVVYDLTSYVAKHPGGDAILRNTGKDASLGFHSVPAHKYVQGLIKDILEENKIGKPSS